MDPTLAIHRADAASKLHLTIRITAQPPSEDTPGVEKLVNFIAFSLGDRGKVGIKKTQFAEELH